MGGPAGAGSVCIAFRPPILFFSARVAKLVDAPGLGPDAGNSVGVRVPPRAPLENSRKPNEIKGFRLFFGLLGFHPISSKFTGFHPISVIQFGKELGNLGRKVLVLIRHNVR